MKNTSGQWILAILFLLYLIMDYRTPTPLAMVVNTVPGKVIVLVVFLSLFFFSHPLLGILGLFVGFELIRRSSIPGSTYSGSSGYSYSSGAPPAFLPSQQKQQSFFSATNQFPSTLEEEVVKQMTPASTSSASSKPADYKPLLDNIHNASNLR